MAERTLKEQQESILLTIREWLRVTSPYSIWNHGEEPILQVSRLDNHHRTATDIELLQLKGSFVQSDYFYLMAAACFQYATAPAICSLVRYWNRRDVADATRENRERLIIPNPMEAHASRMRDLCKKGVLTRYDFFINPHSFPVSEDAGADEKLLSAIYRTNSVGCSIYQAALEKRPVSYNLRTAFYTEAEQLRWVQNSILTGAFLNMPCIRDAKFQYQATTSKRKVQFMSYLTAEHGSNPVYDCNLILESVVLNTNEKVVTRRSRVEEFRKRIRELVGCLNDMTAQTGRKHLLVLCIEDGIALKELQMCLDECAGPAYAKQILVTSGTVLYMKQVIEHDFRDELKNCFLTYTGNGFTGALGYYFLLENEVGRTKQDPQN